MTDLEPCHAQRIDRSDAVTNGSVLPYYLADRKIRVAVARVNGRLHAFGDLCTCSDEVCPLSGGLLTGATITCQCHGSRFDIVTGAVVSGPAARALTLYEVREVNGTIQVRA